MLRTFNPIKVLFLQGTNRRNWKTRWILSILSRFYFYGIMEYAIARELVFQSYQGSIFTGSKLKSRYDTDILSILSRFYFYERYAEEKMEIESLSILSRFYFYSKKVKLF